MVLFIITIIHKSVCLANVKNHTFVNQMVSEHIEQESRAVAGNPRDAAVIFDP